MNKFDGDQYSTVGEAKSFLKQNLKEGAKCPCCSQYVKLYLRKLNSSMAYGLILMTRNYNNINTSEWFHLENYFKPLDIPSTLRGDLPKLRHWGLIEAKEGEREDGNPHVGYYRVTSKGKQFVNQEITVPQRVGLYNQKFYGFDGRDISIVDALGSKFNYKELMSV